MIRKKLCGLTVDEIMSLIEPSGFSVSHALSISYSIYKERSGEISQIAKIPKKLKEELSAKTCSGIYYPVASQVSVDKTVKYMFRSENGLEYETVYIPENKRTTVCVSVQSGCRMGCPFCATGNYGFHGNLTAGDIVNQVINIPGAEKVTHVVFMGMGEPMDNLENVLKACRIITSEWGLALSSRNVTVSTVGITPGVEKFLLSSECNLTVSLHSPFPEERKLVIPIENRYPVIGIVDMMKNFPAGKRRRLSLAYVMINGMNDSDSHLEALKVLLKGSKIRVNLIPFHTNNNNTYTSSSNERMQYFKHNLVVSGISASIRKSRGTDISAACGLLASSL